jgi:ATP-dependent Clp protease protease subunit
MKVEMKSKHKIKAIELLSDKKKMDLDSDFDDVDLDKLGVHMMFGEVDEDLCLDACEFIIKSNFAFHARKILTIMINSPGGSVYDGFGIIDLMGSSRLRIRTVAIGAIASMGAVIFTAGTPGQRIMTKNAYMMTHQFSHWQDGKYHELVATREHEDELHERFIKHFITTTKMSEKQIRDIILGPSDKWLSSEECLKLGLCDKIQNPWDVK